MDNNKTKEIRATTVGKIEIENLISVNEHMKEKDRKRIWRKIMDKNIMQTLKRTSLNEKTKNKNKKTRTTGRECQKEKQRTLSIYI